MHAREVLTAADARRIVEERDMRHVKVGVFDMDGIMRGKYMSRDKFLSALEGGFGFCTKLSLAASVAIRDHLTT